ncbi:winged helix-turn-helix transcriptional regulator [Candidatus Saccharibacteria bacterium]|nr:winged helix-turn-helix transcriptional regulator [Candidatus Saccharibacteria bacterium]
MSLKKDDDLFLQVLPLFNAMGDKTRQEIILLLAHHAKLSVGELTKYTHLSRPAVSHHIKILREAELITETREGAKRYYQPTFIRYVEPMRKIIELVDAHELGYDKTKGENNGE